jgi:MFS family permease
MASKRKRERKFGVLGGVAIASVSTSLAVFLVGALAVQIRPSLHLTIGGLGTVVSIYYLSAALSSVPAGRLAESFGGARTMRAAAAGAAVSLACVALLATSAWSLAAVLVVAGMMDAAMQPATNLFLIRRIRAGRRGLAFGVKQASVPFTALLAGLAVPAIALTFGWRWAFLGAAALATVAVLVIPRPRTSLAERRRAREEREGEVALTPLMVLTVGFGLGMLATAALTTFMVSSMVATGFNKGLAGIVVATAGGAAVLVRVAVGVRADRTMRDQLPLVSRMLLCGVAGYAVLALATATHIKPLFVGGAIIAYGAGWGWNGLFSMAISVHHPSAPAKATGITLAGNRTAGIAGPSLFALLVTHASYTVAWLGAAGAALSAALVIFGGYRMLSLRTPSSEVTTLTNRKELDGPGDQLAQ